MTNKDQFEAITAAVNLDGTGTEPKPPPAAFKGKRGKGKGKGRGRGPLGKGRGPLGKGKGAEQPGPEPVLANLVRGANLCLWQRYWQNSERKLVRFLKENLEIRDPLPDTEPDGVAQKEARSEMAAVNVKTMVALQYFTLDDVDEFLRQGENDRVKRSSELQHALAFWVLFGEHDWREAKVIVWRDCRLLRVGASDKDIVDFSLTACKQFLLPHKPPKPAAARWTGLAGSARFFSMAALFHGALKPTK